MAYWLFKSEPEELSIDHLAAEPARHFLWDGVRNYQARNFLRDQVQQDDLVLIYHSSCKPPGIAGIAKVSRSGYPDPTQFDSLSPYYDAKAEWQSPRWYAVDVCYQQKFNVFLPLDNIKKLVTLKEMPLVKKGNRLSIMPITASEWQCILSLIESLDQD